MNIEIIEASQKKEKPDWSSDLGFGKIFTDHMFTMDWQSRAGAMPRSSRMRRSAWILQVWFCIMHRKPLRG